jgi:predicted metallo-beta-lactamase superfamily hydrolase
MFQGLLVCIGDGDDIGNVIDFYLLSGDLDSASKFSFKVKACIEKIASDVQAEMAANLVYVAGDDIYIFACCMLEDIRELYTFNIKTEPNFSEPWKMLVHHLEKDKEYDYVNLVETPIFRESTKSILIRTLPLVVSIVGTLLFVSLTLAATFILGTNAVITQAINTVGVALGIASFFLIYFPIRGK